MLGAPRRRAAFAALALAAARGAAGACFKHAACAQCITEEFPGGSCIWYTPHSSDGLGTCIAGRPGYVPVAPGGARVGVDTYARWSTRTQDGQEVAFTAFDLDRMSEGSCYSTGCTKEGACAFGYYAVQNEPCYSERYTEWRRLECCRQQRNIDGYLRGFDAHDGVVQGNLFYAACCSTCYPGHVNSGCDAYNPGACQRCPPGRFNPLTLPGSACGPCQPCAPGLQRTSCGPSLPGRCEPCPAGTFKTAGLEGAAEDSCQPCTRCPPGTLRVGCGPSGPGTCEPCAQGEWFASPYCRECSPCLQGTRHGCGGAREGVCSPCARSRWTLTLQRRTVEAEDGQEVQTMGEWWSDELESGVQEHIFVPRVQLPPLPPGLPGGAGYFLRLALADLSASCCAASASAPLVANTPDFALPQPAEEEEAALEAAGAELLGGDLGAAVTALAPACGLPAAPSPSPSWASRAACERLAALRLGLPLGPRGSASAALEPGAEAAPEAAARGAMIPVARARDLLARWEGLVEASGELLPDTHAAWRGLVSAGARGARRLRTEGAAAWNNASPWNATSQSAPPHNGSPHNASPHNSSNASNSTENASSASGLPPVERCVMENGTLSSCSSPLRPLWQLSSDTALAADDTWAVWHSEVASAAHSLEHTLDDLQDVDSKLANAARAVGFDVVRMAQSVTLRLWDNHRQLAQIQGSESSAWFLSAFETIGSMAMLLLGTWGATWRHSLEWGILAGVGNSDAWSVLAAPDISGFGGARPAVDAVPLSESRKRVWEPFRNIATAWLDEWAQPRWRAAANATPRADTLAPVLPRILALVEELTEEFLEPLTRGGSALLAGPLPNVSGCGAGGRCLGALASGFSAAAARDARLGLGQQSIRPWLDARAEERRLQRAAAEVAGPAVGRARVLDALLSQLLRARELQLERGLAGAAAARARAAAAHLAALATGPVAAAPPGAAAWHWRDVRGGLRGALASGRASAARLGRHRLSALERLAAWAGGSGGGGAAAELWRRRWSLAGGTSGTLDDSMHVAGAELERALAATAEQARLGGAAFLRLEFDEASHPLVLSSLSETNSAVLWLEPPPGSTGVRMHAQALAFLISPDGLAQPLEPSDASGGGDQSRVSDPHVELELRRLFSDASEPLQHDSTATFITRHPRRVCQPLGGESASAGAFLPLHGLWLLQVRDGPSRSALTMDAGTSLRLMFKVDIPAVAPPWQLLAGMSDVLYEMPANGYCNWLRPIWGSSGPSQTQPPPATTTTEVQTRAPASTPAAMVTRAPSRASDTATTVPPAPPLAPTAIAPATPRPPFLQQSSQTAAGFDISGLTSQPLVLAFIFGAALGLCCCCTLLLFWGCRRLRARRTAKVADALEEEQKDATSASLPDVKDGGDGLRRRMPSPKPGQGGQLEGLRTLAMASEQAQLFPAGRANPEVWHVSATPRRDDGASSDSQGEGDSDSASEGGKSWREAATPSAASTRSRGSSSGSSSSGERGPTPEGAAAGGSARARARAPAAAPWPGPPGEAGGGEAGGTAGGAAARGAASASGSAACSTASGGSPPPAPPAGGRGAGGEGGAAEGPGGRGAGPEDDGEAAAAGAAELLT